MLFILLKFSQTEIKGGREIKERERWERYVRK